MPGLRQLLDGLRRRIGFDLLVLSAAPLVLLAVCPDWIYTPPDSDSWLYHGCFFQLPYFLRVVIADTYPASRLPWTLPGYLIYRLLPPPSAYLALHLVLCYAALFSLYYIVRKTVNRNTALLGGLLFCTHFDFCLVFGTDYVIAPAITYLLLALACLTKARSSARPRCWNLAAGGALAAAVIVYPTLAVFLPLVGLYALVRQPGQIRPASRLESLTLVMNLTLGGLAALVGFGLASALLGGRFFFFMPTVKYILRHWDIGNSYRQEWDEVLYRAHWLVFPAAAALSGVGLLLLALVGRGRVRRQEVLLGALGLGSCLCFLGKDLAGDCYLQNPWHAALLLPFVFLGLCAFLLKVPPDWNPGWTAGLAVLTLAGASLVMTLGVRWVNPAAAGTARLAAVGALIGVAFLLKLAWGQTRAGTVLSCVALLTAYVGAFEQPVVGRDEAVLWGDGPQFQSRVDRVLSLLQASLPNQHPVFWYNKEEKNGREFTSICSTYGWAPSLVGDRLPDMNGKSPAWRSLAGNPLVVLSEKRATFSLAEEAVRRLGKQPLPLAEEKITSGGPAYWVKVYEVRPGDPLRLRPDGALTLADQAPLPPQLWSPEVPPPHMGFELVGSRVEVRTLKAPSGYVLRYGLVEAPCAGNYLFVLHYRLRKGNLRLGCLDEREKNWLATATADEEHEGWAGEDMIQAIKVSLAAGQRVKPMVSNDNPKGRSTFEVTGLYAYKLKPPA